MDALSQALTRLTLDASHLLQDAKVQVQDKYLHELERDDTIDVAART
jgi:hypothetical protein